MKSGKNALSTIDGYISGFPEEIQIILQKFRKTILEVVPEAKEKISYQMPTFTLNGKNMVHFAAYKNHIGFYPTPSGISQFKDELQQYKNAKGSVQFPINKPFPYELIWRIVEYRKNEMMK